MPLIQCKLGPTTQNACGTDYVFERDAYGRYVARVDNLKARAVFLSVEHYVEALELNVWTGTALSRRAPPPD